MPLHARIIATDEAATERTGYALGLHAARGQVLFLNGCVAHADEL